MIFQQLYYILFILIFLWLFYKKEHILCWVPLIYILLDSSFSFFPTLSIVTYLRPVFFAIVFLLISKRVSVNPINKNIFIFLAYNLLILFFSPEIFYSLKGYMQVLISMMAFPVAFAYFNNAKKIALLNKALALVILFSILASVFGYVFDIGKNFDYNKKDVESIGLLGSGGLYPAAFAIGIFPFLNNTEYKKYWKWLLLVSSIIIYIFILLNVRRTAIFLPVVGLLVYAWYTPQKIRLLSGVIAGLLIMALLSPLYTDILSKRFKIREEKGRFDSDFYKTEGRYIENISVFTEALSFKDPIKSFFGYKIYASGRGEGDRARMLHSDSAVLLGGTGFVGLILYIIIYIRLFQWGKLLRYTTVNRKLLLPTYYSILFMSIFISLNGSLTLVSIRTLIFLYLGAILSFAINNLNPRLANND